MTRKRRFTMWTAGLLLIPLVISACGGGGGGPAAVVYTVSGMVKTESDSPLAGVAIRFSNGADAVTTGADGSWQSPELSGTVTVTPAHDDYAFTPESQSVGAKRDDVDFTGSEVYDAAGQILDEDGDPVPGVTVGFGSAATDVVTDAEGRWSLTGLVGSVTATPSDDAYTFVPATTEVSTADANVDFAAEMKSCNSGDAASVTTPCVMTRIKQLQAMIDTLDGHFALGGDVDASAVTEWTLGGLGFTPVGTPLDPFTGTFDGNGHKVTGLFIDRINDDYVGLFGYIDGAKISSVELVDAEILGYYYTGALVGRSDGGIIEDAHSSGYVYGNEEVGGLVGRNDGGTVENSSAAGRVIGNNDEIGGLVGRNTGAGSISGSHSSARVHGYEAVGGLVGNNRDLAEISSSHSSGSVRGDEDIGGLVGQNDASVTDSYSTASVYGDYEIGGLVGYNLGSIENSYSSGTVTGREEPGGLVGYQSGSGSIKNSYSTSDVRGVDEAGGLVAYNSGLIEYSYSSGTVASDGDIGGLVGYQSTSGTIRYSYSTVEVSGNVNAGGLVGHNTGSIDDSYSLGAVTASERVGGLVGNNSATGNITNAYSAGRVAFDGPDGGGLIGVSGGSVTSSYWDTESSQQATSSDGDGKTTAEMRMQATYAGWSFGGATPVWQVDEGAGYPDLIQNLR